MKRKPKPKIDRQFYVGYFATEHEHQMVVEGAQARGMTMSAYLRYLVSEDDRSRRIELPSKQPKRVAEYAQ